MEYKYKSTGFCDWLYSRCYDIPVRRQTIIWTNKISLSFGHNENIIEIQQLSFKKMHLSMSFAKWRPFCLGPNVAMLSVCRYRATLISYRVGAVWCSPSEVRKDQPCLPFRGLSQGRCHLHAVHVTFRWGLSCCSVNYKTNTLYTLYAWIDLNHKSQNAPVPYPTMLHSGLNGALWDMEQVYSVKWVH